MSAAEVLATLPLLIYGIAIAELFSQWKRFIRIKQTYVPYALMTVVLTEIALYNVFLFSQVVDEVNTLNYGIYLTYLLPAIIFMIAVYSFTPEKEDDTEAYFRENMSVSFTLIAIFVATHFLYEFDESETVFIARVVVIIWLILTAVFKRTWMVYVFVGIWFLGWFSRGFG